MRIVIELADGRVFVLEWYTVLALVALGATALGLGVQVLARCR